jgi:hypothetical protein
MKSNHNQSTKCNYIAGDDNLQLLTVEFREKLIEWLDEAGKKKLVNIDGEDLPMRSASVTELLDYAIKYTEMWAKIPRQQKEDFKHKWFIDCRGLYISGFFDFNWNERGNFRDWAPVQFDYSIIDTNIPFFAGQIFLGDASFYKVEFRCNAHFNEVEFHGEVIFDSSIFSRAAVFSNCLFKAATKFQKSIFSTRVDFSNSHFKQAPIFHGTALPQATSFFEASFDVARSESSQYEIQDEIVALRTLRQLTTSYKGQQDEARFFAFEQRAHRKGFLAPHLVWHKTSMRTRPQGLGDLLSKHIEWLISWTYDSISEYGSNPTKPVFWLFGVNLTLLFIYRCLFTYGDCQWNPDFCLAKDVSMLAHQQPALFLILQNLFNPSAFVSSKASVIVNNGYMLILAVFQLYLLLILAALAIRARFQKGGSGDK